MRKIVLIFCFMCCSSILNAQEIINYFEVGDNIATPVTIKTNLGDFQIYGGESISGAITSLSAYDANGNLIVQNSYYKSSWDSEHTYHYRYYRFISTYNSSTYDNNKSSSESYDDNSTISNETARNMGHALGKLSFIENVGSPNLQVREGLSLIYSDHISLKAELGGKGGLVLSAGYGTHLINNVKQTFYAGFAFFIANDEDGYNSFTFLGTSYGINIDGIELIDCLLLEYSHHFEGVPRLGYYINASVGCTRNDQFYFNVGFGLSWKLFAKLPYLNFE